MYAIVEYILGFFVSKKIDKNDETFVLVDKPELQLEVPVQTEKNYDRSVDSNTNSDFDQKLLNRKNYNQKKKNKKVKRQ